MEGIVKILLAAMLLFGSVQETPIVCNVSALTTAERQQHAARSERLKSAIVRIEDVTGGYRLYLNSALPVADLLAWVEGERRCCAFLDFEIGLAREDGARWLQMTGREGVKEFLSQEMKATPDRVGARP
jgi:hypothetical protein